MSNLHFFSWHSSWKTQLFLRNRMDAMDGLLLMKYFAVTRKIAMTINRKFTVIIIFILIIVEKAHTKSYNFSQNC